MEYRHSDININKDPAIFRVMAGILIPVIGLIFAILLWKYNPAAADGRTVYLFCAFNKITGLYCPGCGMTRAAYELLHLNIIRAIRDNALMVLVIYPAAGYLLFREYVHYVFDHKIILPAPRFRNWMIITIAIIIMLFTVLRNIPIYPFYYLTPIN